MFIAVYKATGKPVKKLDILTSYRQQKWNFDRVEQATQHLIVTAGGGVEYTYHQRTFPEIEVRYVKE